MEEELKITIKKAITVFIILSILATIIFVWYEYKIFKEETTVYIPNEYCGLPTINGDENPNLNKLVENIKIDK